MGMCFAWWLKATRILLLPSSLTVCPIAVCLRQRQQLAICRDSAVKIAASVKPEWLLEERWQIQPSNLQNLKSDSLSNTWKTTLPSPWLEGKNEKLAYARWRFLASKIGLCWFSPIPSCSFCKTHKEHIWGHFSELATVSAFEGNHMDTNKATMDEGLGIPGVQKQDAWALHSRSSVRTWPGPKNHPNCNQVWLLD